MKKRESEREVNTFLPPPMQPIAANSGLSYCRIQKVTKTCETERCRGRGAALFDDPTSTVFEDY